MHDLNRKQKFILRGTIDFMMLMLFMSLLAIPTSFVFMAGVRNSPSSMAVQPVEQTPEVAGASSEGGVGGSEVVTESTFNPLDGVVEETQEIPETSETSEVQGWSELEPGAVYIWN